MERQITEQTEQHEFLQFSIQVYIGVKHLRTYIIRSEGFNQSTTEIDVR